MKKHNRNKVVMFVLVIVLTMAACDFALGNDTETDINDDARVAGELWFSVTLEIGDLQKHADVETCSKERIDTDGDETFATIDGKYEHDGRKWPDEKTNRRQV